MSKRGTTFTKYFSDKQYGGERKALQAATTALTTYGTIYVLPSEDEWYKAAYLKSDGSGYTLYATGDSVPTAGTGANYNGANSAPWNVGSGTAENNGTYDMGGNVWEWGESAFAGGEPTGGRLLRYKPKRLIDCLKTKEDHEARCG